MNFRLLNSIYFATLIFGFSQVFSTQEMPVEPSFAPWVGIYEGVSTGLGNENIESRITISESRAIVESARGEAREVLASQVEMLSAENIRSLLLGKEVPFIDELSGFRGGHWVYLFRASPVRNPTDPLSTDAALFVNYGPFDGSSTTQTYYSRERQPGEFQRILQQLSRENNRVIPIEKEERPYSVDI